MRLLFLTLAFALVALASPISDNARLDEHWEMWKSFYGKEYEINQLEERRRAIWEDNLNMINRHNLEYSMGMHTYTMAMNRFGDLVRQTFCLDVQIHVINLTKNREDY